MTELCDLSGVENSRRALTNIETQLMPLLSLDRREVVSGLTPLENAHLNVCPSFMVSAGIFTVANADPLRATRLR
jgi:hypothetical protein